MEKFSSNKELKQIYKTSLNKINKNANTYTTPGDGESDDVDGYFINSNNSKSKQLIN